MRIIEYIIGMPSASPTRTSPRWELYKLLGEPVRLRLLGLAAEEELAIGELAELLDESQPNVSRHLKPLRTAGLLTTRKQGTRVFIQLDQSRAADPVVRDAVRTGSVLCADEGRLARIASVIEAREAPSKDFFARPRAGKFGWPDELAAYLSALAPLMSRARLAVDVGTGDGALLDVLAPIFDRVLAFDRSEAQLEVARERVLARGYSNVELSLAELGDPEVSKRVDEELGADAVFAARVLHHAPRPNAAVAGLASLLAPGGALVVLDYAAHDDESMRSDQADAWLGFRPSELEGWARQAGLETPRITAIPSMRCGSGPDGHLDWQVLAARKPSRGITQPN